MAKKNPTDNSNRFGPVSDEIAGNTRRVEERTWKFITTTKRKILWYIAAYAFVTLQHEGSLPVFLFWSGLTGGVATLLINKAASDIRNAKAANVKQLLDVRSSRRISLWNHTSAVIGGWEATVSSDAGIEGEFEHPLNLIAAIDAIERHIELFAPNSPGLSRLRFCASAEFFELWCAQTPEDVAALRSPIVPALDREIRSMLERVRQEAVSGQRVFDVAVGSAAKS